MSHAEGPSAGKELEGKDYRGCRWLHPAVSWLCPRVSQQAHRARERGLPSPELEQDKPGPDCSLPCPGPEADGLAHSHAPLDAAVGLTEASKPGTSTYTDTAWRACFPSPPNC